MARAVISDPKRHTAYEPLYENDPETGDSVEIFYADPAVARSFGAREAGWFWMRRGEQHACVGCHAGPETAPENAVPMILLKSTTPTDLTGAAAQPSSGGH